MSNSNYLYIGSAVVIVMIVCLIAQARNRANLLQIQTDKQFKLLIDTDNGVINVDNTALAAELLNVKKHINDNKFKASDNGNLSQQLDDSIANLNAFINVDPRNGEALCTLEMRNALTSHGNQMHDLTNKLDLIDQDRDTPFTDREKLEHLINNLDVAIALLRNQVCDYGRLDISKLYKILNSLNEQVANSNAITLPHAYADVKDSVTTPYLSAAYNVEPFMRGPYIDERETPTRAAIRGFEELATLGIAHKRSPGHLIAQLDAEDKPFHYSTRVAACLGKTVPDDELIKECGRDDVALRQALDGDPSEMLNCANKNCDDYMYFYDAISDSGYRV